MSSSHEQDTHRIDHRAAAGKKAWSAPTLTVHGDARALTEAQVGLGVRTPGRVLLKDGPKAS